MALTIREMFDSRRWNPAKDRETGVLEFVGYGTDDDAEARAAFDAAIPATFTPFLFPLTRLSFDLWTLGGKFWRATAPYGPDPAPLLPAVGIAGPPAPVLGVPTENQALGPDYSFDFTGVTEKITQSKATVSATKRGGGAAPDTKGAIGVTADGQVQGCERISPNQEWSKSVTFGCITLAYIKSVSALVGNTNISPFYTFPAGSLIFMGDTAQTDDTYRAKVTFKFLHVPNATSVVICSDLVVAVKRGADYLWVSYKSGFDANRPVQVPDAAYVERIVDDVDFSLLGIRA